MIRRRADPPRRSRARRRRVRGHLRPLGSRRRRLARGAGARAARDRRPDAGDRAQLAVAGRRARRAGRRLRLRLPTPCACVLPVVGRRHRLRLGRPITAGGSAGRCTSRCSSCSPARAITRRAPASPFPTTPPSGCTSRSGSWRSASTATSPTSTAAGARSGGGRRRCASTATARGPPRSARRLAGWRPNLPRHRQLERERRAVDEHPPGVLGGDRGDDREPEPGAGTLRGPVAAPEALKQLIVLGRVRARPGVADGHPRVRAVPTDAHRHHPARRAVDEPVLDQVAHRARQRRAVAGDLHGLDRPQRDALRRHRARQLVERHRLAYVTARRPGALERRAASRRAAPAARRRDGGRPAPRRRRRGARRSRRCRAAR